MSGFYRKAVEFLARDPHPHLKLVKTGSDSYEEFDGTPEEREQIESEIRGAVESHRISRDASVSKPNPQQPGIGLPLIVNIGAIVLIAVGTFFLFRHFNSEEQLTVDRTVSLFSAEGRLLSALRTESEAQLEEKEREISAFQNRLTSLEAERRLSESQIAAQLAQQEEELRARFERELEAERSRLDALDIGADEIERRLAAFADAQNADFNREFARVQADAQAEIEAREATFTASLAEVEDALRLAEGERESLERSVQEQQEQAATELAARETELRAERTDAMNRLSDLQARHEQTQLVFDQLVSFYAGIRDSLSTDRLDAASEQLASLRSYLESGPIAAIPEMQRRRRVELFLVGTLESELARRSGSDGPPSTEAELARATEELETLRTDLSAIQDELNQNVAALSSRDARVSELETRITDSVDAAQLERLEAELAAVRAELAARAAEADRMTRERDAAGARAARSDAAAADTEAQLAATSAELAETSSELTTATAELAVAAGRLTAAERAADAAAIEIASLRELATEYQSVVTGIRSVRAQIAEAVSPSAAPDLELLETKLLVLRIVGSPAVRSEHPDLHARFNAYLDALVAEQRSAASRRAFEEISELIAELPGIAQPPTLRAGE